jgi:hypothetical protein
MFGLNTYFSASNRRVEEVTLIHPILGHMSLLDAVIVARRFLCMRYCCPGPGASR